MNSLLRKLTLSILTLLLVIITFVTSAYAFLNIANFNLITGLEIGFSSGDDLEISIDGINYSKTINPYDIEGINHNFNFVNVTTFDNERFDLGPKYLEEEAIPNNHYLSFQLYFRLKTKNEQFVYDHLYLANKVEGSYQNTNNLNGTYAISQGVKFNSPIDFQYSPDTTIKTGNINTFYAHDALRIGILNKSENINFIYDISENSQMGFGMPYGAIEFYNKIKYYEPLEIPTREPNNTIYELTQFDPGEPDVALNDTSLVSRFTKDSEDEYYRGQITVNIWLEGWDANSFDGIYRDAIKIQLMFIAGRKR